MPKLANVQVLRAVAAFMIVVHHCGIETARMAAAAGHDRLFNEDPFGNGVSLFFAISGFIMVVTTEDKFGTPGAAADFMRRRLIRIVPLYWAVTTVALAAALAAPHLMKMPEQRWLYTVSSYLFLPFARADGFARPLATPGWTLNLEMLFYVVFALALLLPRRFGLPALFGSLGLLVSLKVAGLFSGVSLNFWGDPIVLGFLFGVGIGIAYVKGVRLSAPVAAGLVAAGVLITWFIHVPYENEDDLIARLSGVIPATIIMLGAGLGPQLREDARWMRAPLFVGEASYSLYLVHEFLLRPMNLVWGKIGSPPLWLFVIAGVTISLVAASATYLLFEKPVTRWLNRMVKPSARSHATMPALASGTAGA